MGLRLDLELMKYLPLAPEIHKNFQQNDVPTRSQLCKVVIVLMEAYDEAEFKYGPV